MYADDVNVFLSLILITFLIGVTVIKNVNYYFGTHYLDTVYYFMDLGIILDPPLNPWFFKRWNKELSDSMGTKHFLNMAPLFHTP